MADESDGDASRWTEATSGTVLLKRVKAPRGFGEQKGKSFVALPAKQLDVQPDGWEKAAGDYALDGYRSVADVTTPETLQMVRDYKKAKKAAGN